MNVRQIDFSAVREGICHTHPSIYASAHGKVMTFRVEDDPPNYHSRVMVAPCRDDWTPVDHRLLRAPLENKAGDWVLEDARLFMYNGRLHYTATDRHRIGIGEFDSDQFAWLQLEGDQKNWQFFEVSGRLIGIQWTCPHTLWGIDLDYTNGHRVGTSLTSNKFDWAYGEPHGGTSPIAYGSIFISLFHSYLTGFPKLAPTQHCSYIGQDENAARRVYFGAAYAFESRPPFRVVLRPKEPLLWPRLYAPDLRAPNGHDVVFPCGLIRSGDTWTCSWGDDRRGFISTFTTEELFATLAPV